MSIASMNTGSIGRQPEDSGELMGRALHKILGIKSQDNLTFYKLLGIEEDESDPAVIESAADRQMAHVRVYQTSKEFGEPAQRILNRISLGRVTLLNAEKKAAYDETLRMRKTQQETRASVATVVPVALPIANAPIINPIVFDTDARVNRATPQQTTLQKYGYAIAAGAALTVASIGALWATSSSGKGSDEDPVAAKAELNPGKNELPVTPVATRPAEELQEEVTFPDEIEPADEIPELAEVAPVNPVVPEEVTPPEAAPVAPEEVQLAQAPEAVPQAPMVAATKLPERRDLAGLAAGTDTDFNRVDVPQAELDEALKSLNDNFASADVTKILELLTRPTITSSPARTKAVLEFAMAKAKASPAGEDDATAFEAVLGNAHLFKNEQLHLHAASILDGLAKRNDAIASHKLIKRMAGQPAMFPREFIVTHTTALFKAVDAKKGDALLPVLANDLVALGVFAPRDAMMAEARDLREQATDPSIRKPANAELALQLSLRMINLAKSGAAVDPVAAQALIELAKRTVGPKYNRSKEFLDVAGNVESIVATAKREADFSKILEADPANVRALQGRADLRLAQGDVEGALDDMEKAGNDLAKQTRALRSHPKGNECYRCGLEWLKLSGATMNGRKASMIVLANEQFLAAKSAKEDKVEGFALEALDMKLSELKVLMKEHGVTHVQSAPVTVEEAPKQWKSIMSGIDLQSSATVEWSRGSDGVIVVKNAKNPKLKLPLKLPAGKDFDEAFQFDVSRTDGKGAIQFSVPFGNGATVVLNGWHERGGFSGITNIDGLTADKNETTTKGIVLPAGNVTVELRVRRTGPKGSVLASVNGKKIVEWEGEISRLSPHKDIQSPENIIIAPYEAGFQLKDIRREVPAPRATGGVRVQTMKPVIEAGDMEPAKPKGLQEFEKKMSGKAMWNKETGSWYFLLPGKMSFAEANQIAKVHSASVAVVDSPQENDFVYQLGKGESQWLGIGKNPRDGKLYQANGEPVSYLNWGRDEGTNPREPYVQLNGEDGSWQDYPEGSAYVCLEWKTK